MSKTWSFFARSSLRREAGSTSLNAVGNVAGEWRGGGVARRFHLGGHHHGRQAAMGQALSEQGL